MIRFYIVNQYDEVLYLLVVCCDTASSCIEQYILYDDIRIIIEYSSPLPPPVLLLLRSVAAQAMYRGIQRLPTTRPYTVAQTSRNAVMNIVWSPTFCLSPPHIAPPPPYHTCQAHNGLYQLYNGMLLARLWSCIYFRWLSGASESR